MTKEERLRVEKVIINIPDRTSLNFMFDRFTNLKEVWFGPGKFYQNFGQKVSLLLDCR